MKVDRELVAWSALIVVLSAILLWLGTGFYPQDSVAVSSVKIDYFNDTMTFEYNGEKWFVRFPEHGIPPEHTGIRVKFNDGKPVLIWVHRTGYAHYQNIWEGVVVLEAKKLTGV